ncbi:MAG: DNA repair protein RecN [Acidobacteria bacterium]|nr:DNA repair protein RecN [Acidobacteriota bacterium]
MLKLLNVLNLALVSRLCIEFEPGLNVLTGETGSGKSIVVDSLGMVLGGRSSPDMIRTGEQKACVEAVFSIPHHPQVLDLCTEHGLEVDLDEFLIRREITSQGRNRVFIQDQLSTVNFLKQLRPFLVDIHGQGDQQTLLHKEAHSAVLDAFGGIDGLAAQVREAYEAWDLARKELEAARQGEAERLRRVDMLAFQCQEIEAAKITNPAEDVELEAELHVLSNAEKLVTLATSCFDALYEDESSILTRLATVLRRVDDLSTIDPSIEETLSPLHGVRYVIEDAAFALRDYAERVRFSPERLKQIEDRLIELTRLKRKYGPTLDDVVKTISTARIQLKRLGAGEEYTQSLEIALEKAGAVYLGLAETLSARRRGVATDFERALMGELKFLAMEATRIEVGLTRLHSEGKPKWGPTGLDEVEFLVSPNIGEELRSLAKVASGGEISRLMLALKTITAPTDFPRTMVFDEVDAGIGGRVAEAVGQRLKRLSDHQQVLCVTHLAQIARFGASHLVVWKDVVGTRTETFVERLGIDERVNELARMIGGASVTEAARRAAQEMLTSVS